MAKADSMSLVRRRTTVFILLSAHVHACPDGWLPEYNKCTSPTMWYDPAPHDCCHWTGYWESHCRYGYQPYWRGWCHGHDDGAYECCTPEARQPRCTDDPQYYDWYHCEDWIGHDCRRGDLLIDTPAEIALLIHSCPQARSSMPHA